MQRWSPIKHVVVFTPEGLAFCSNWSKTTHQSESKRVFLQISWVTFELISASYEDPDSFWVGSRSSLTFPVVVLKRSFLTFPVVVVSGKIILCWCVNTSPWRAQQSLARHGSGQSGIFVLCVFRPKKRIRVHNSTFVTFGTFSLSDRFYLRLRCFLFICFLAGVMFFWSKQIIAKDAKDVIGETTHHTTCSRREVVGSTGGTAEA